MSSPVVSERSVSKTAYKLSVLQPSMRSVIGRLRRGTGDRLIVRRPMGMEAPAFGLIQSHLSSSACCDGNPESNYQTSRGRRQQVCFLDLGLQISELSCAR